MEPQNQTFNVAIDRHRSGKLDEALDLYKTIYNTRSKEPKLLYHMGLLCYQQNNLGDSAKYLRRAVKYQSENFDIQLVTGLVYLKLREWIKAKQHLVKALELQPVNIEVVNYLIILSLKWHAWNDADTWLEKSTRLHNSKTNAFTSLSMTYQSFETPVVLSIDTASYEFTLVNLLYNDESFQFIYQKLMHSSDEDGYLDNNLKTLFKNKLFTHLLKNYVVYTVEFEVFLTKIRKILLNEYISASGASSNHNLVYWSFICSLSEYVWMTEYIFTISDEESHSLKSIVKRVNEAYKSGIEFDTTLQNDLMILFLYHPLHRVCNDSGSTLLTDKWPDYAYSLINRFIEYQCQMQLKDKIKSLTEITDAVSNKVQEQYEEFPYPRWHILKSSINNKKQTIGDVIQSSSPSLVLADFLFRETKVLIAGCGTGQEAINLFNQIQISEMLAIDLSRTSLAYAIAKSDELGINSTIKFRHADILNLKQQEQPFDVITSSGVLHHLDDPFAGWHILCEQLRPGGFMRIALYSAHARKVITEIRANFDKEHVNTAIESMRSFRQEIFTNEGHPNRKLIHWNDFYTASMFRDLVFHENEHCFSIHEVKECLDKLGLQLIGFTGVSQEFTEKYRSMYPSDPQGINLDNWAEFEEVNPTTFSGMYKLSLIKR